MDTGLWQLQGAVAPHHPNGLLRQSYESLFELSQQSALPEPKLAVVIGTTGNYWLAAAADSVEWLDTTTVASARLRPLPSLEASL